MEILIVGGGIGGLTTALTLHQAGIACRVFEAAPEIKPLGLGVNLLPHATRVYADLGLLAPLQRRAVTTKEAAFFNRFGQLVYREPLGLDAGYPWPQLSIHRGDLQEALLAAFLERIGPERLHLGHRCTGYENAANGVAAHFADSASGAPRASFTGDALIAADGLHSVIRRSLYPDEGDPVYSGVNMWRGATVWTPFLSGATMVRAGWLATGKLVLYPIRNDVDGQGRQLVNWVFELETPVHKPKRDWNKPGRLDDFIRHVADWHFDWLDVPAMLAATETVLEFPMVDQDPLPAWTFGRVTLLGDAAHPMVPRGSNGAGQAVLDAAAIARAFASAGGPEAALNAYEAERLPITTNVVLTNRREPPDAILGMVYERTGDRPFGRVEDVISAEELAAVSNRYKQVAGFDKKTLGAR